MRISMFLGFVLAGGLFSACGSQERMTDLCERTFVPYPDLISGRVMSSHHAIFLNAMQAYSNKDFEMAADSLTAYLGYRGANKAAHFYLTNSYLALGKPFDAELHLDHLENSFLNDYRDQWEWYTVVCWVCSGQLDRARVGANRIIQGRRHTYRAEAERLLTDLDRMAKS